MKQLESDLITLGGVLAVGSHTACSSVSDETPAKYMSFSAFRRYRQGMSINPRAALDRLVVALEEHLRAVQARRGEDDPAVDDAYYAVADAFEIYDSILGQVFAEALPLYVAEDDDDDEDGLDEDDLDDDDEDPSEDIDLLDDDDIEAILEDKRGKI